MIRPEFQLRIARLIEMPSRALIVIVVFSALAISVAVNVWLHRPHPPTHDLTYSMKRAGALVAACLAEEPREVRILMEQRVGHPWRQFSTADQVTAIDYLIDELIENNCLRTGTFRKTGPSGV